MIGKDQFRSDHLACETLWWEGSRVNTFRKIVMMRSQKQNGQGNLYSLSNNYVGGELDDY